MIAGEYFAPQTQLATVVAPVAIYFLILGLLNLRRHPQLITARQDVLLLTAALSPLLILPLAGYVSSATLIVIVVLLAAMALVAFTFGPAGGSYVVYNLTHRQALRAIERTLDQLGLSYQTAGHRIQLDEGGATIDISSFSLLRNVSIRIRHANPELSRKLADALSGVVGKIEAQTSSMAVGLLIVATAMLVAPAITVVHRAPEIVRILTDLLH